MSPQIWSSQDVNAFKCAFDLQNYLRDNGISCLFAIDVLLTFRLLKGSPEVNIALTWMLPLNSSALNDV